MTRSDGRSANQLRPVTFQPNWISTPEGSCLIDVGNTRVLVTASVTAGVPRFKKDSGEGWITAEYSMLPRATNTRNDRESVKGKLGGRTQEISRLIGRSMRSIVDMKALGENTIVIDCDVLQADGGTRCASITGAYVALALGLKTAVANGLLATADNVLIDSVSAVSVGIIDSEVRLDLHYDDDVAADVDMNVVMTGTGGLVEVQGTAEGRTFSRDTLNHMMDLATVGCIDLSKLQAVALK